MLQTFDELVARRTALQNWWRLGSTKAKYDNARHVLRVDFQNPTMVAFCGQEYAGAKNYHDAPKFVAELIRKEADRQSFAIAKAAYDREIARLNEEIKKHCNAVLEQLSQS